MAFPSHASNPNIWDNETYKLMTAKLVKSGDLMPRKKKLSDDFFDMPLPDDKKGAVRAALIDELT